MRARADAPRRRRARGSVAALLVALALVPVSAPTAPVLAQARSDGQASAPTGVIPSVRATVTGLRFFEGPSPLTADGPRSYDDVFFHDAARYVYWELFLTHPAPGQQRSFTVEEIWQGSGVTHRSSRVLTLEPHWTSSVFLGSARIVATKTVDGAVVEMPKWPWGTYQVDLLVDKQPVARGWFTMGSKEQMFADVRSRSTDRSAPTRTIFALDAKVTALRFFEAGAAVPPRTLRRYATQFPQSTTRNILWEVDLEHTAPGQWMPLTFEALLYHTAGGQERLVQRKVFQSAAPAGSANTSYMDQLDWSNDYYWDRTGATTRSPRAWQPGPYRVDLYVTDIKVASGSFEVR